MRHLWRSFIREDERGSGRISYDRAKVILRTLNVYRDKRLLRGLFDSLDIHATGTLAFDQFVQVRWRAVQSVGSVHANVPSVISMQLVDMLRDRPDIAAIFNALSVLGAAAASNTDEITPEMPPASPLPSSIHAAVSPPADVAVPQCLTSDGGTECGSIAPSATASPTLLLPVTTFLYFLRVQQVRRGVDPER